MTHKILVLIGLKHVGKSTVGNLLAKEIEYPFFDSDHELENIYYQQTGNNYSFSKIYQLIGDRAFKQFELMVCQQLLKKPSCCVIALGGSAFLNQSLVTFLKKKAIIVYLKANKETLLLRWQRNPPQFIKKKFLEKALDAYYKVRSVSYCKQANLILTVDKKSYQEICFELKNLLVEYSI